jgi:hypothetical protein
LSWFKDENNPLGRGPESELWERLRWERCVRFPREGDILPMRPLEGNQIWVTWRLWSQEMPSQWQQSMEDQFSGGEDVLLKAKDKREWQSIWLQAWFVEKIQKRNKVRRRWYGMVLGWYAKPEEN